MLRHKIGAACAVAGTCFVPAHAADLGGLKINGFGQVVVGSTLNNNKQYPTNATPSLSYDADPKFDQESLFALQVTAPLTDKLSATAQIVSHGSDNFSTEFEWAYINYQLNSDWSVKIGRQRDPLFYYSDYLEVGVAYPWLRAPSAVYGITGSFSNIDGVTVNYSGNLGDWEIDPQLLFGRFNGPISAQGETYTLDSRNAYGLSVHVGYSDWFNFRAAYFAAALSIAIPGLNTPSSAATTPVSCTNPSTIADAVESLQCAASFGIGGPQDAFGLSQAAQQLSVSNQTTKYIEVGLDIEKANWLLIGEFVASSQADAVLQNTHDGYIGLGHHFGRFTPMFTYGRQNDSPKHDLLGEVTPGLQAIATLEPSEAAGLQTLENGLETLAATTYNRNNFYQWDLRYDLASNVALKLDYTRFHTHVPTLNNSQLVSAGVAFSF